MALISNRILGVALLIVLLISLRIIVALLVSDVLVSFSSAVEFKVAQLLLSLGSRSAGLRRLENSDHVMFFALTVGQIRIGSLVAMTTVKATDVRRGGPPKFLSVCVGLPDRAHRFG